MHRLLYDRIVKSSYFSFVRINDFEVKEKLERRTQKKED